MSIRRANTRQHFPEMRNGDIFMGAFNAEQVMYNHFGYRTPVERLYMAGSGRIRAARSPAAAVILRRHHRARSRLEAVVEAVGRGRGAGGDAGRRPRACVNIRLRALIFSELYQNTAESCFWPQPDAIAADRTFREAFSPSLGIPDPQALHWRRRDSF